MEQEIRFCAASDGVRIAYATAGSGPPLVRVGTWLTHLEYDEASVAGKYAFLITAFARRPALLSTYRDVVEGSTKQPLRTVSAE